MMMKCRYNHNTSNNQ